MAADQMIRNLSMKIGDVGLGSIELCVIAAEGGCTHKDRGDRSVNQMQFNLGQLNKTIEQEVS